MSETVRQFESEFITRKDNTFHLERNSSNKQNQKVSPKSEIVRLPALKNMVFVLEGLHFSLVTNILKHVAKIVQNSFQNDSVVRQYGTYGTLPRATLGDP